MVVSSFDYHLAYPDVILMAVTSQLRSQDGPGDLLVSLWKEAGLLKPSLIKPLLATLEKSLVIKRLGRLNQKDQAALCETLKKILGA